jgi:hypothetical protein
VHAVTSCLAREGPEAVRINQPVLSVPHAALSSLVGLDAHFVYHFPALVIRYRNAGSVCTTRPKKLLPLLWSKQSPALVTSSIHLFSRHATSLSAQTVPRGPDQDGHELLALNNSCRCVRIIRTEQLRQLGTR